MDNLIAPSNSNYECRNYEWETIIKDVNCEHSSSDVGIYLFWFPVEDTQQDCIIGKKTSDLIFKLFEFVNQKIY